MTPPRIEDLLAITGRLSAALTPEEIADVVLGQGVRALAASTGGVWLTEPGSREAHLLRAAGFAPAAEERYRKVPLEHPSPLTDAIRGGEPVWIESQQEYASRYPLSEARARDLAPAASYGAACLPLLAEGHCFGGLALSFDGGRRFSEADRSFLVLTAGQCALALGRARLYERTEEARAQATLLLGLVEASQKAESLDELYGAALDVVRRGLRVDRAAILLLDGGVMSFKAWSGLSEEYRAAVQGHSPWAPDDPDPSPVLVEDAAADPALASYQDLFARERIGALAFFPLVHQRRLLGKFMVYSPTPRPFAEREVNLARAIAAEIAQTVLRHHAEAELRSSQGRLEAIVGSATDGIITIDERHRILLFNAAAEKMFRLRAAEVSGHHLERLIPTLFAGEPEGTGTAPRGGEQPRTLLAVRADGEAFPIEATTSEVVAEGQRLVTVIVRDITGRRRAEGERERLYREAHEAVRAREELISIASHDLRSPLSAVSLQIERVIHEAEKPGMTQLPAAWVSERLKRALANVARSVELMDGLLEGSRAAAGEMDLYLAEVDLRAVVRDHLARSREGIERSGSALALQCSGPVVGRWDRLRLDQVVGNLVSNALKYGAGKRIDVEVDAIGGDGLLVVRDRGIGIAKDTQAAIFDRFQRATGEGRAGSFGLGLWIVRRIVTALGGTVEVNSDVGQGTEFIVTLPLAGPATVAEGPSRRDDDT